MGPSSAARSVSACLAARFAICGALSHRPGVEPAFGIHLKLTQSDQALQAPGVDAQAVAGLIRRQQISPGHAQPSK
jgi:hypothetical protein